MGLPIVDHLPFSIQISGLVAILFLVYRFVLYPATLSPLANIPSAHWSTPLSSFWILRIRYQQRENRTLHDAHRRLGPIIRTGPNEVSVDGVDAVRIVYQGGFEKASWYSVFNNYGVPCMFSMRTSKEHSLRKRMVANVYSKSFIHNSRSGTAQAHEILSKRLLPIIQESTLKTQAPHGTDVHSIFLAATMDFISAWIFGTRNSTNFIQNKGYREHWLELYKSRNDHHFFPQELPRLTSFCKKIGLSLYPKWVDHANEEMTAWNKRMCDQTMKHCATAQSRELSPADEPVVMGALLAGLEKERESNGQGSILHDTATLHHDLTVYSELLDHVLAGQETAGVALTYMAWRLSLSLDLQGKLRAELLNLEPSMKLVNGTLRGLPNEKQLDSLPLLHAVMMETLRLHAPLPGAQPRQTPYPDCQVGPYQLPGGVRISAMAHTLHRDERVFPDPDRWDPARWLKTDEDDGMHRERNRCFWVFSSGGRMCIGSNFAIHEMKLIIAAIYSNFATTVVDDEGMDQTDGYAGRPVQERLFLRFEPVQ